MESILHVFGTDGFDEITVLGDDGKYVYYSYPTGFVEKSKLVEKHGYRAFLVSYNDVELYGVFMDGEVVYTIDFKSFRKTRKGAIEDFVNRVRIRVDGRDVKCSFDSGGVSCCLVKDGFLYYLRLPFRVLVSTAYVRLDSDVWEKKVGIPIGKYTESHVVDCRASSLSLEVRFDNGADFVIDLKMGEMKYCGVSAGPSHVEKMLKLGHVLYEFQDIGERVQPNVGDESDVVEYLKSALKREDYVGPEYAVIDGRYVVGMNGVVYVEDPSYIDGEYAGVAEYILLGRGRFNRSLVLMFLRGGAYLRPLSERPYPVRVGSAVFWYNPLDFTYVGSNGVVVKKHDDGFIVRGKSEFYFTRIPREVIPALSKERADLEGDLIGRGVEGSFVRDIRADYVWVEDAEGYGFRGYVPFRDGVAYLFVPYNVDFSPFGYDGVWDVPDRYVVGRVLEVPFEWDVDRVSFVYRGEDVYVYSLYKNGVSVDFEFCGEDVRSSESPINLLDVSRVVVRDGKRSVVVPENKKCVLDGLKNPEELMDFLVVI